MDPDWAISPMILVSLLWITSFRVKTNIPDTPTNKPVQVNRASAHALAAHR
jgi:hypothetical protein